MSKQKSSGVRSTSVKLYSECTFFCFIFFISTKQLSLAFCLINHKLKLRFAVEWLNEVDLMQNYKLKAKLTSTKTKGAGYWGKLNRKSTTTKNVAVPKKTQHESSLLNDFCWKLLKKLNPGCKGFTSELLKWVKIEWRLLKAAEQLQTFKEKLQWIQHIRNEQNKLRQAERSRLKLAKEAAEKDEISRTRLKIAEPKQKLRWEAVNGFKQHHHDWQFSPRVNKLKLTVRETTL